MIGAQESARRREFEALLVAELSGALGLSEDRVFCDVVAFNASVGVATVRLLLADLHGMDPADAKAQIHDALREWLLSHSASAAAGFELVGGWVESDALTHHAGSGGRWDAAASLVVSVEVPSSEIGIASSRARAAFLRRLVAAIAAEMQGNATDLLLVSAADLPPASPGGSGATLFPEALPARRADLAAVQAGRPRPAQSGGIARTYC